ncbi:MAG TPA: UDP-2,4-diacetamido-2,4,6-trideoxy-beta-L-altropyranose hydrolase [Sulfuricurvum sp.]|nr:UDP-2,4-diacetamido-2,4,6-trideoxy-beta-L-altropyranose hydrolase [Sulfuricurvum sp.]
MQNILFRADSSSTIGTGHIMRDLVLAQQFKDANIIFATQNLPGNINHTIEEKRYDIELLDSNDIEEVIELIKKHAITTIIIDHYGIDYNYEKALKEKTGVEIFVLDDTYEQHYCDILLNHNIYADIQKYKGLVPEYCELRCGAKYTLLRDEFIKQKIKESSTQSHQKNVFIAMGGADHSNINIEILKVLASFAHVHAHVVTTTANAHLEELKKYVPSKPNITLHINTDQIAKLMHASDLAIVTPSVTLNEIFYMKLPFIAIKTAENQKEMYQYLAKNDYLVLEKFDPMELNNKLEKLIDSLKIELVNFVDLSLNDKKMILEWRNHPDVRKWMFTQDTIELHDHLAFIESLKNRRDSLYFLVKKGNQDIGVIDFTDIDQKNRMTQFGIYTNPNLTRIGGLLMESIIDYAFRVLKIDTLTAEVFEKNIPAIKLYDRYNFKHTGIKKMNHQNIVCMELNSENR